MLLQHQQPHSKDTASVSIKFSHAQPDLKLHTPAGLEVFTLKLQLRCLDCKLRGRHIRLIWAGRELYDNETVPDGAVLHCVPTDGKPYCVRTRLQLSEEEPCTAPSTDWIDNLDLGSVLLWTLGSILAFFWLVYLLSGQAFDRVSLVMLTTMTVSYLVPFVVPLIANLFLRHGPQPCHPYNDVWQGSSTQSRAHDDRVVPASCIPPRPAARLVGPNQ